MCVSRFCEVLRRDGPAWAEVEDVNRVNSRASLLAYDGVELCAGDWGSVHSGYVIDRVDAIEAACVVEEIRRAKTPLVKGDIS